MQPSLGISFTWDAYKIEVVKDVKWNFFFLKFRKQKKEGGGVVEV